MPADIATRSLELSTTWDGRSERHYQRHLAVCCISAGRISSWTTQRMYGQTDIVGIRKRKVTTTLSDSVFGNGRGPISLSLRRLHRRLHLNGRGNGEAVLLKASRGNMGSGFTQFGLDDSYPFPSLRNKREDISEQCLRSVYPTQRGSGVLSQIISFVESLRASQTKS